MDTKIRKQSAAISSNNVHSLDNVNYTIEEITLNRTRRIPINVKRLKKKKIYIDAEDKKTAVAISAYRHLRTSMLKALDKIGGQVLLVTGPTAGVGKTTTAINLAISIARGSQRTAILIDLDLRRPSVHKIFDYHPKFDIIDLLRGKTKLEDILVTPHINRLTLLTGKRSYENSSELLGTKEVMRLILRIKNRYPERIVVIDAPPILGCDDVETMSRYVDAGLIVVNHDTYKHELLDAMERIRDIKIVGHVINRSKEARFNRYYY